MKRFISILLTVALIFSLFAIFVSAEEITDQTTESRSFHAPTIRNMIEVNLESRNTDEEFYHLLANAYLTDPVLLTQTIEDLTDDEIAYLAKAISYVLQKTGRVDQAVLPADCGSAAADIVARMIVTETGNAANATLLAFMDIDMTDLVIPPAAELNASPAMYIDFEIASTSDLRVGESLGVTVTARGYSAVSYARTYFYEIHKIVNGVDTVAGGGRISIPANQLGATVSSSISFSTAGNYTVYVKLLQDFETVIKISSSYSLSVYGKWHITVELTADRSQLGTITLYDASGTEVSSSICLGKSARNLAMNQEYGHTPIGVYTGYLDGKKSDTEKYGPHQYIRMHGYSGYVVEECNHRNGLLIHGGREGYNNNIDSPSYPLYHTEGCVRVTNSYQQQLENEITTLVLNNHETIGFITITQDGQITL